MKRRIITVVAVLTIILFCFIGIKTLSLSTSQTEAKLTYIDGEIVKIDYSSEGLTITVQTDSDERILEVLETTYIGNATKSPPKDMSFLEEGMSGTFTFYLKNQRNIVKAINIIQ